LNWMDGVLKSIGRSISSYPPVFSPNLEEVSPVFLYLV
jgi:hypothetical protein